MSTRGNAAGPARRSNPPGPAGKRHVVITGATSGIGAALMRGLAAEGCTLYVCGRRAEQLSAVTEGGTLAYGHTCDVSDEAQVRAFAAAVGRRATRVDALINCAGVFGAIGPAVETDSKAWLQAIHTNLFGTYLAVKAFLPLLERGKAARIINFSGGGAFGPFPRYSAYAASKAAVVSLTENLALELAERGIAVNAVAPGLVATGIHEATLLAGAALAGEEHYARTVAGLRGQATPIDVPVACVRFLLSEAAGGLTGKTISAGFDPWGTPEFVERVAEINSSDLYTLRRKNLENLPDSPLRTSLLSARRPATDGGAAR